ncbi:MAG: TolC family protein [Azoarcus sp.]|jgi:cobalt-zinc-cadmium efflux system outer membrane protein|nr:TolC family protein [Azoarcus sp.]
MRKPYPSNFGLLGLAALVTSPLFFPPAWAQQPPAPSAAHPQQMSLSGSGKLEPTAALHLAAAIELALSANPELSAAARELLAVEGALIQAGVRPNPEISVLVEDTRDKAARTTTVQIDQPVELGGKRAARIALAEREREAAAADLAAKRLEIRANVTGAFFDVLAAQQRVRQAEDLFGLARRAALAASRRVTAGKISPVEETRAKVAEASVRVEFEQARGELAVARKRLAAAWGNPSPRFERAEGRIDVLPGILSPEEIERRLQISPALARARFGADRQAAAAELERTRRFGDVTVSLGSKRAEELGRNQTVIGLSVPLPLFDRNRGNVLEATQRAAKARDELAATEIRLMTEAAQTHERLKASVLEAETLQKEILPGAQGAYEAAGKGFELGKFSFLEVLDAQRTFFQAQSRYLQALAEAHRAAAELDRALGAPIVSSTVDGNRP